MRAAVLALAVTAVWTLGGPAGATTPVTWYTTTINNLYVPADVTMVRGDKLRLLNLEAVVHNVVASDTDGLGNPLFQSGIAGRLESVVVVGAPQLPPGAYPFYCSVHEEMLGLLTVV